MGTARPMLEMLMARKPPLPRWPSHSAIGSAISDGTARAVTLSSSCWTSSVQMPSAPCQCDEVVR